VTVTIAGSSSGDSPTASATANSSDSIPGRPSAALTTTTNSVISTITFSSTAPKSRTPRSKLVSGTRVASRAATRP